MYKGIIYCVTSPKGKKYYGQTIGTIENRIKKHRFNRKTDNTIFHNALKKYGWKSFKWEIIENILNESRSEVFRIMNQREFFWIEKDKTFIYKYGKKYGYNMTKGGQGIKSYKHSEETKKKISKSLIGIPKSTESRKNYSKANSGKNNPMYGKRGWKKGISLTSKEKENLRNLYLGKTYEEIYGKEKSIKIKNKLSISLKGKTLGQKRTNKTKNKIREKSLLRFKNPLEKEKISKGLKEYFKNNDSPLKGKSKSEETKRKISEALKRNHIFKMGGN